MRFLLRPVLVTALIATAACGDPAGSGPTTEVTVRMKDAPGDVLTAVVTVAEVSLTGSGGNLVLTDQETTVDLLTLTDATVDLVTDAVVPSGRYAQLRFRITGGYIEVENEDGSTSIFATENYEHLPQDVTVAGDLHMPSYAQSGMKVNFPGALEISGDSEILLVDFSVEESFGREAGASGQWVMDPVITGTTMETGEAAPAD